MFKQTALEREQPATHNLQPTNIQATHISTNCRNATMHTNSHEPTKAHLPLTRRQLHLGAGVTVYSEMAAYCALDFQTPQLVLADCSTRRSFVTKRNPSCHNNHTWHNANTPNTDSNPIQTAVIVTIASAFAVRAVFANSITPQPCLAVHSRSDPHAN